MKEKNTPSEIKEDLEKEEMEKKVEEEIYKEDVLEAKKQAVYKLISFIPTASVSELVEIVKILRLELGEATEINKNINDITYHKQD